ncbi:hypothetical protein EMCRGX_G029794 [Ephydatia muelleri]
MQNSRGEPFGTSDSWTKYIQSIFKQLANVAISSNALRSSFVTDLLTSRNRPSDDLLAEVAFAMRHSSREQSRTYDRRSSADKVTRAVALTSERVATALDVTTAAAPAPVATTTSSKRRRRADDDDDDDDDNVAPEVGDIVGAVDDSSTLRKPFVHFGNEETNTAKYPGSSAALHSIQKLNIALALTVAMVDLETAARWFKDALDAPGAVESATQLRTLLASIKADLQRLLRRIHPPGPPTVPRAPRVVAHAVLSEQAPRLSSASDCSSLAPESPRSLRPSSPSPSPPPPSTPPRPSRSRSNSPATASSSSSAAAASAASAVALRGKRKCGTISQVSRGSDTRWQLQFAGVSLPIESAVAGASCTATIASCEPDVLARYVSCLVECEQLDPNLAARLESLVEDAARLTSGMSLFDQVRTLFGVTNALQNLTNWRVGRILMDAPGRDDVELANFCGEYLTRLLRDLVAKCSDQFGSIASHFPTGCISVLRTSAYPTSMKRIYSFERLSTMPWNLVTSTPWWQHGKTMSLGPARDSPPLPLCDDYQALVHARHALATAKVILLVCHGVHRGDGGDRMDGDAAEPQAVTIITEVASQAAESRPLQPANSDTPAATCMSRKREVLLFDASLFPSLTAQLSAMKKYFEEPLSTSRRGERLAESTVATTERRILTFLGFAKLHAGASNPELRLVSDLELVKRFFHYLENERQSSSGNQFAYCLSFLRAMRYLKSDSDTIKTV